MNNLYALFDWDNTVREGYTLFSWIDYLRNHSIIKPTFQDEIGAIQAQYKQHLITHDEYAEIACSEYANALTGIQGEVISKAIMDYMHYDCKHLFTNLGSLFDTLYSKGVDIIVISGAPLIVISQYLSKFHIKEIYAFKEKLSRGVFTGEVEYNYGFNKAAKVRELMEAYGNTPFIAFGDSESDLSMLNEAKYSFCVGDKLEGFKHIKIISQRIPDNIIEEVAHLQ